MVNFYFPNLNFNIDLTHAFKITLRRVAILKKLQALQIETGKINIPESELSSIIDSSKLFKSERDDYLSHFLLKLAFYHDTNAFEWFYKLELQIFRHLLSKQIKEVGLNKILENIKQKVSFQYDESSKSFILPFEKCTTLFSNYRVIIKNGYVIVSTDKMKFQLERLFLENVKLDDCFKMINKDNMSKVKFLLKKLQTYNPNSSVFNSGSLDKNSLDKFAKAKVMDLEDIPKLAKNNFPPCMYLTYLNLINNGHLKHGGRLTLSLFLKEAGLKYEKGMAFWRNAFSKNLTDDQFDKLYGYNFRYNYGKEGKGTDFSSYGCSKLINMVPNSDDVHGCPFKNLDMNRITQLLRSYGITENSRPLDNEWVDGYLAYKGEGKKRVRNGLSDMLELVKNKQYQVACGQSFNLRYNTDRINGAMISPIQYYFESLNLMEERETEKREGKEENN